MLNINMQKEVWEDSKLKNLKIPTNALKHMNLILLTFYQHQD